MMFYPYPDNSVKFCRVCPRRPRLWSVQLTTRCNVLRDWNGIRVPPPPWLHRSCDADRRSSDSRAFSRVESLLFRASLGRVDTVISVNAICQCWVCVCGVSDVPLVHTYTGGHRRRSSTGRRRAHGRRRAGELVEFDYYRVTRLRAARVSARAPSTKHSVATDARRPPSQFKHSCGGRGGCVTGV